MTSYTDITNIHYAHNDAWDGSPENLDGCTGSSDYSKTARTLSSSSVPTPSTFNYEPIKVIDNKPPKLKGPSFNYIKATIGINMTPYSRTHIETSNYLAAVNRIGGRYIRGCSQTRAYKPQGGTCSIVCKNKQLQDDVSSWTEQGDLSYWQAKGLPLIQLSDFDDSAVVQAVIDTRNDSVQQSYSTYDALSDLAELPETLKMFRSGSKSLSTSLTKMLSGFSTSDIIKAKDFTPHELRHHALRALRKLGNAWMTYRYGIMPVIYSFHDIQKAYKNQILSRYRSVRTISPTSTYSGSVPTNYIGVEKTGNITVKSTVACLYRNANSIAQRMSGIAVNPFQTAWELIPYSWIADWFLNVGDWITTHLVADYSAYVLCCTSIREVSNEISTLNYHTTDTVSGGTLGGLISQCWPNGTYTYGSISQPVDITQVVRVVSNNTYSRDLFLRKDTNELRFNPSLNWKRYTDAGVLAFNQVQPLLRALSPKDKPYSINDPRDKFWTWWRKGHGRS